VPDSVGVSPIFVAKSGKEKEGSVTSDVDLSTGRIGEDTSVAVDIYSLGVDYFYDASKLSSDGLVSWWKFDGNFEDSIGDNHGTSMNGAQVVDGVLSLDGVDDYVMMSGLSLTEIAGDKLTVSAWVKPTTLSGTQYIIVKNGPIYFHLSGNKLTGIILAGTRAYSYGTIPLDLDWNYVVMVYDGVNVNLYVNGQLDSSAPRTGNLNGDGCFQIGRYTDGGCNSGAGSYFKGQIDNVMVFKRALFEDEIKIIGDVEKKG